MIPNTESTIDLQPGDRIYFYSDGLTEAGERSVEMFGSQRLMAAIDENRHLPLRASMDAIINTAADWQGNESNNASKITTRSPHSHSADHSTSKNKRDQCPRRLPIRLVHLPEFLNQQPLLHPNPLENHRNQK